jgi:hypothetical protein
LIYCKVCNLWTVELEFVKCVDTLIMLIGFSGMNFFVKPRA